MKLSFDSSSQINARYSSDMLTGRFGRIGVEGDRLAGEPGVEGVGGEDHRHAVVDGGQGVVRRRGQYRATLHRVARRHVLAGRDVVARPQVQGRTRQGHEVMNFPPGKPLGEASAHGPGSLPGCCGECIRHLTPLETVMHSTKPMAIC